MVYEYREQIVDTPLAKELYKKMMAAINDDYLTLCLMAELHTDEHVQKMMDIIDSGETDTNVLSLAAIDIYNGRI